MHDPEPLQYPIPAITQPEATPARLPEPVRMVNKKLQIVIRPTQRTCSHQTNQYYTGTTQTAPTYHTVSAKTDVTSLHSTAPDEEPLSSDEGDDEPTATGSDEEYSPSDDNFR